MDGGSAEAMGAWTGDAEMTCYQESCFREQEALKARIVALEAEREKLLKVVEAARESLSIETPVFLVNALKELDK